MLWEQSHRLCGFLQAAIYNYRNAKSKFSHPLPLSHQRRILATNNKPSLPQWLGDYGLGNPAVRGPCSRHGFWILEGLSCFTAKLIVFISHKKKLCSKCWSDTRFYFVRLCALFQLCRISPPQPWADTSSWKFIYISYFLTARLSQSLWFPSTGNQGQNFPGDLETEASPLSPTGTQLELKGRCVFSPSSGNIRDNFSSKGIISSSSAFQFQQKRKRVAFYF